MMSFNIYEESEGSIQEWKEQSLESGRQPYTELHNLFSG